MADVNKATKGGWEYKQNRHWNPIICAVILYNVLLTCVVIFGGYYLLHKTQSLQAEVNILKESKIAVGEINIKTIAKQAPVDDFVASLKQTPAGYDEPLYQQWSRNRRSKREVLSSNKDGLSSLLKNEKAKTQGTSTKKKVVTVDFRLEMANFVNTTTREVLREEWPKLLSSVPTNGGAIYIRWGRETCPAESARVYEGLAAGSTSETKGGGANYLCLPSDPIYNPTFSKAKARFSVIGKTIYDDWSMASFGSNVQRKQLACAVCEARQRLTKITIPASTRCPDESWTLEYEGLLVSQSSHFDTGISHDINRHYKSTFECLDLEPQQFNSTDNTAGFGGAAMYVVSTTCSGSDSLNYCPPYKPGQPLSCVVCTK